MHRVSALSCASAELAAVYLLAPEQMLSLALLSRVSLGSFIADIQLGNRPGHLHHVMTPPDESSPQHVAEGERQRLQDVAGAGVPCPPSSMCGAPGSAVAVGLCHVMWGAADRSLSCPC